MISVLIDRQWRNIWNIQVRGGNLNMHYCKNNQDKMVVYSFCMTILIVIYHLIPHLIDLVGGGINIIEIFLNCLVQ